MSATQSPVTGVIAEGDVIIEFGTYQGKTVREISELDNTFYQKLIHHRDNGVYAIRRHKDKTFRLYLNPLMQLDQ